MSATPLQPLISENCRAAVAVGLRHFLRHFVGLGLVFATLSASLFLTVDRVGSSLKHVVQQRANQLLAPSGWQLEFESMQFVEGEGIRLRGLTFQAITNGGEAFRVPVPHDWSQLQSLIRQGEFRSSTPAMLAQGSVRHSTLKPNFRPIVPAGPSIRIDSLWLRGSLSATDLLQGHFQPTAIEFDTVLVDLPLSADQHLCFPKLTLPKSSTKIILPNSISLDDVTLQVSDGQGRPLHRFSGLHCKVTREQSLLPDDAEDVPEAPLAAATNTAWQIGGQVRGLTEQPIQVCGRVDSIGYDLAIHCAPFYWHPQASANFLSWLPPQAQVLSGISGQVTLDEAKLKGEWVTKEKLVSTSDPAVSRWQQIGIQELVATGQLSEIVVQHALLPQPILRAGAKFRATAAGVQFTEVVGSISEGNFAGWLEIQDWSRPQATIQVRGHQIPFNHRWVGLLSERMQQAWQTFQPEGHFDCDLQFAMSADGALTKRGTVDARDVKFLYREFPLPVSQVNGRINLENDNCQFNLEANDPRCPVVFEGWANDMGPNWTGQIDVRSTKFHPYSESLLDGLQKKPEAVRVIQDMNFAGMLAANGFIKKSIPKEPADVRFNVNIHGGELRHRLFPYRMFGLTGMVSLVNGVVSAEKIEGVSSTGNITISGQSIPGSQWWVNVVGRAVELNQELYQALSANQKSVWDQISPQGTLDHLLVRVQNLGSGLQVSVDAYQQPSTPRDPSNLRIEPNWFRYALDRLSGKVHYSNGEIKISDIQGWHGNIPVSFDADGQSHAEYWQMTIRDLLTGQIPIDHDIKQALPHSVRTAANRMALTGSVVVQGNVSIFQRLNQPASVDVAASETGEIARVGDMTSTETATLRPNLSWDLRIDVENAAANLGVPVQHIHGNMQLRGLSNQETAYCGGQVHFDSAMVQGVQTTAIQGPYWCNEQNVLFGTAVGQLPADIQSQSCGSIDSVTANCFGGRLSMDGQVVLDDEIQFQIQSSASQIDLAQLAKELAPQTREIVGFGSASLLLAGTSTGTHSLDGGGRILINDAKLYEVPFFLQLLKTLQVKTPDKTAFDKGSIDFGIKGSDIECHRIELNGDAISLIGTGRANLSQELDLNFYTVLGRNNFYLPVLSDLVHAGSQQLLWISVKGTVEKPLLTRETFRALNEAVRLLLEPQE